LRYPSLFRQGASEGEIAETLLEGVTLHPQDDLTPNVAHTLVMPQFDHLTEEERRSIALFVISLRTNTGWKSFGREVQSSK
jgi:hypothetical protein